MKEQKPSRGEAEPAGVVEQLDWPAVKVEVKRVKCRLTDEEKLEKGAELVGRMQELTTLEGEFEEVKAGYKAKMAEAEGKVAVTASVLRAGFEWREVECVVEYRPKDGKKDYRRAGHEMEGVVLTEDMRPEDFQVELPVEEKRQP
jgi:hypothetical protein